MKNEYSKFEVGDKVRVVDKRTDLHDGYGLVGVVVKIDTDSVPVGVDFGRDVDGCELYDTVATGHGWWFKDSDLELVVEESPPPKKRAFEIGDKVRVAAGNGWANAGSVGVIVKQHDDHENYQGIQFEDWVAGHDLGGAGKNGHCYYIESNYLEVIEKKEKTKFDEKVVITLEGRKTTVQLEDGSIGIATAMEKDDYNQETGIAVAWAKALIVSNKDILEGHQKNLAEANAAMGELRKKQEESERQVRLRKREIESLKNDIKRIGG